MNFGLGDGYKLLKLLDGRISKQVLDHKLIDEKVSESDEELAESIASFQKCASEALTCLKQGEHEDKLLEKLILMRVHAIHVSTCFEVFVDEFEKILKEQWPT